MTNHFFTACLSAGLLQTLGSFALAILVLLFMITVHEFGHYIVAKIFVELVVAGFQDQTVFRDQGFQLKERRPHRDIERLEFVGAADAAAVVVRHDRHGFPFQRRIEHALAGNVEVIPVNEADHFFGTSRFTNWWITAVTTPNTFNSIPSENAHVR